MSLPVSRELLDSYVATVKRSVAAQQTALSQLSAEVHSDASLIQTLHNGQRQIEAQLARIEDDLQLLAKFAIEQKERRFVENSHTVLVFTSEAEDLEEFIKTIGILFRSAPTQFSSDAMKCSFFISCFRGRAEDFALQLQRATLWAPIPLMKDYDMLLSAVRGRFGSPLVAVDSQQLAALGRFAVNLLGKSSNV